MAIIGTFTTTEDGVLVGSIKTVTVDLKLVEFRPAQKANASSPDYVAYSNGARIGTARMKTSKARNNFLSVRLDDPSFPCTIFAALMASDDGHNLVWSRPRKVAA